MTEGKYKFRHLAPTDAVELKIYEDAINHVFYNPNIKNVAISGAYGSGKSSILESYKRNHKEIRFLHISLAHFSSEVQDITSSEYIEKTQPKSNDKKPSESVRGIESVLEGKILNQIIHQIPSYKIPQTNFRVKKTIRQKCMVMQTLKIILLLLSVFLLIFFSDWKNYVLSLPNTFLKDILKISTHPHSLIVTGIIITFILSNLVYALIEMQKNRNIFRKLKLQGNEIEIFEESNDSFFDKYLNEVLYLFENVDADVIVFEDIDRFNAIRIFERLREVNTLTNVQINKDKKKIAYIKLKSKAFFKKLCDCIVVKRIQEHHLMKKLNQTAFVKFITGKNTTMKLRIEKFKNRNKKTLRFFYLLRDDIFISKDRSKFFDFIIPVVPIVDSSNSFDTFISVFKASGLVGEFDEGFLQGLSLYIDDMRTLLNIHNEFLIYYDTLNTIELDSNRMLAMVTYKNIFPKDFADLQLNKGFVYTIFSNKDKFIKDEKESIRARIQNLDDKIKSIEDEPLKTIEELDLVFRYTLTPSNLIHRTLDKKQKEEYSIRKETVENKIKGKNLIFEEEKLGLENELIMFQNNTLSEIITRENIKKIFSITSKNEIEEETMYNEIKSSDYFDLLKYLIRNGYIDETYNDYMTYFYGEGLNHTDKIFLRSISDKIKKDYTYKLTNPMKVVARLKPVDFNQEEIFNFDLLDFLLQNTPYIEYVNRLIDQLKNTKNFKFIKGYFESSSELSNFANYLNLRWPEAFSTALYNNVLTEIQIKEFSFYTLCYSDEETTKLVNAENCLSDYISSSKDYLSFRDLTINESLTEKLIYSLILLKVNFVGFDLGTLNRHLLNSVYENSLYQINSENIPFFLREILKIDNNYDIIHKNYTQLLSKSDSAITLYIHQNFSEYIDVVNEICQGVIKDDEYAATEVLNNDEIDFEQKKSYINALQTKIERINDVHNISIWPLLLEHNIVPFTLQNIIDYFNERSLDSELIDSINKNDNELDLSEIVDEDFKLSFYNSVVTSSTIHDLKFKEILTSLNYYWDNYDLYDISNEKMNILIDGDFIDLTEESIKFIRDHYPLNLNDFIRKNIDKYAEIIDSSLFIKDELLYILTLDISDQLKIKLISNSKEAISIFGKDYSPEVCLHILEYNLFEEDLNTLFASYDKMNSIIQAKIRDLAISHISEIIKNSKKISSGLKDQLLKSDQLMRESKIDLFIVMLPEVKKQMKAALDILDLGEYYKLLLPHKKPTIIISEENKKLLEGFKTNNLISGFSVNPEKEGYYKVNKNKGWNDIPVEML